MNKTKFIRSVASACQVVFSILKVLCIIGAVGIFIGVLSLSFLPRDTVVFRTETKVDMEFDLRALVGEAFDEVKQSLSGQETEGLEVTENGFRIVEETPIASAENHTLALSIIPTFAEMIVLFFFYRYLSRVAASIKEAQLSPFTSQAAKDLKCAGISLFFLAGAPAVCSTLIALLTHGKGTLLLGETNVNLETILWGFVLFALSYLFEYGALLSHVPTQSPVQEPQE